MQLRNGKTSASIPDELRPFAPLAEKWHRLGEDPERCARLARGDSADPDLQELAAFANAWSDQRQAILEDWADRVSPEDAEIVPFFSVTKLVGELELLPDVEPPEIIDRALHALSRHGSDRRAAQRWFAAFELLYCDVSVERAIDALHTAVRDKNFLVRASAHCSLAVLEGDLEAHRCSIQIIREERGADDHGFVRFVTDDLLKELDKHPGEREFDALVHACAMNDLAALRRRLHSTEVYAEGDCGLALLGVAIACSHPRAVAFLLQHGLDPSIDLTQETLLHMAAPLRRGEPAMVRALLEHGANPHLHDKEGHTALSIAEEFNRHENARMLRAFGAK